MFTGFKLKCLVYSELYDRWLLKEEEIILSSMQSVNEMQAVSLLTLQ